MSYKKFIIITSIYEPSEAVKKFATWKGWQVVVVGDRKTPKDWSCEGVKLLSIDEQYELFPALAKSIPENTYTRKTLGYLYAILNGAEAIFETDDDNLPYDGAQEVVEKMLDEKMHPDHKTLSSPSGWSNVYAQFGSDTSWPRGYPLQLFKANDTTLQSPEPNRKRSVIQFLADQDPDVDAVYRMVVGDEIMFTKDHFLTLAPGTYSPFNSQATLWTSETFPLLFFPLGVPDRVTDILRGYIALAVLWKSGRTLAFASPVVYQERNPHNLLNDFVQETMLYHNAQSWAVELQKIEGSSEKELFAAALKMLHGMGHISENNLSAYDIFIEIVEAVKAN
jgi:hypothetical protein